MNATTKLLLLASIGFSCGMQAQHSGVVSGQNKHGNQSLPGAQVYIQDGTLLVQTDDDGRYEIVSEADTLVLIFTATGHRADTVISLKGKPNTVSLIDEKELNTFEVVAVQPSTYLSSINPIKTEIITEQELFKAACCNVSESFQNSATVDITTTDAVTGSRQIQMLGLSGIYLQNTIENLPLIRGLDINHGLSLLPGTWVESIQVSKGVGSVANGFESITGQINTEIKKPDCKERGLLNLYLNQFGRSEANLIKVVKLNEKLSTNLLVHGSWMDNMIDQNRDGFMDSPDGWQGNVMNRWFYRDTMGRTAQLSVRYVREKKYSGTTHTEEDPFDEHHYEFDQEIQQWDVVAKAGYVFKSNPRKSIGFLGNFQRYTINSQFDARWYQANQHSVNANVFFQNQIGFSGKHKYRTGANFWSDQYEEYYTGTPLARLEQTAGGFFEYTGNYGNHTLVAGLRADHNFLFGGFVTPRLHYKWNITERFNIRASGGRGQRTANVLAENMAYLVSSRTFITPVAQPGTISAAYDLRPEVAWNGGTSFQWSYFINGREGSLSGEYFYTWFERQTVIDLDAHAQKMLVYNVDGKSFANSTQLDLFQEINNRFDLRMAYRYTDAWMFFNTKGWLEKPFTARHRALASLSYHSRGNKFMADVTINYISSKRMPDTRGNPEPYQMTDRSPDYALLHAQVTYNFEKLAVYVGGENLTGVIQSRQIISPEDPHNGFFDAAQIWGPTFGQVVYIGMRWKFQ